MESIYAMLKRSQLRWAGHVCRMPDERLPKRLLYGELHHGKRSRGGQRKRYKDTLKASLKSCGLDPETWEADAQHRSNWRSAVKHGVTEYESQAEATAPQDQSQFPPLTQPTPSHNMPALQPDIPCKNWPYKPSSHPQNFVKPHGHLRKRRTNTSRDGYRIRYF